MPNFTPPPNFFPGALHLGLAADDLDVIEIRLALEDELQVEIPDDEAEKISTVGDLVGFAKRFEDERNEAP
ncbi:MAG: acyl carrier protein [Myxococcota bacterium]